MQTNRVGRNLDGNVKNRGCGKTHLLFCTMIMKIIKVVIKIELFGKDWIFGDFKASDFGLTVVSFNYGGESEDETGFKVSTIEKYIGNKPVPLYLGDKYEDKLKPKITLCKNSFIYNNNDDLYFSERDCRWILRKLTGIRGYQWMKLINHDDMDDIWFKSKVKNILYKRICGKVSGIIIELECDSSYGYSSEFNVHVDAKADIPFYIFNNTDDLTNYVLPVVTIMQKTVGKFTLKNVSDNNWTSELLNSQIDEMITIDSKNEILSSSNISHSPLLNDFNFHWIRLIPDKNSFVTNTDASITFNYRVPRKVGFR